MIKIPKLPPSEELEYKEKEFLLSIYEQVQSSSKFIFILLLIVLILAFPMTLGLKYFFAKSLIVAYRPPPVNITPYAPADLKILKVQVLPVDAQNVSVISVIAQILNPNAEISAHNFDYEFVLKAADGQVIKKIPGQGYILARESKFILEPSVPGSPKPVSAELVLGKIRWTIRSPAELKLEILQKNSGQMPEGNFFVEGILKNLEGFGFRKIEVQALVFDVQNQNVLAVNKTILTELRPFESRYFRMIWPRNYSSIGQIQIIATVNSLDPGLILEKGKAVPVR